MPDNIRVIARFRPLNEREKGIGEAESLRINVVDGSRVELAVDPLSTRPEYTFTLDRVFPPDTVQPAVFAEFAPTVQDVLQGFHGTIFAYGQTGSGKTFSMFGPDVRDPDLKGIIPRAVQQLFEAISRDTRGIEYTIKCSFVEIYREVLRDLLNPRNTDLKIRESKLRGVYVENMTEESVTCEDDVMAVIQAGERARSVAATNMNAVSSRSHSLLLVSVTQREPSGATKCGVLNLADLAGSERVDKTGARGETLEEAKKINQSLSSLGNCIHALTEKGRAHIPYRDSKLTFILRESLGGNSKTTLLVACSPHASNLDETLSTLRFAVRAKTVQQHAVVNKQLSAGQLQALIAELKADIATLRSRALDLESQLGLRPGAVTVRARLLSAGHVTVLTAGRPDERQPAPDTPSEPGTPSAPGTPTGAAAAAVADASAGDATPAPVGRQPRSARKPPFDAAAVAQARVELEQLREEQAARRERWREEAAAEEEATRSHEAAARVLEEERAVLERDVERLWQEVRVACPRAPAGGGSDVLTSACVRRRRRQKRRLDEQLLALQGAADAAAEAHAQAISELTAARETALQHSAALVQQMLAAAESASGARHDAAVALAAAQTLMAELAAQRAALQQQVRAALDEEAERSTLVNQLHAAAGDAVDGVERTLAAQARLQADLDAVEADCHRLRTELEAAKAEQRLARAGGLSGRVAAIQRSGRPPSLCSLMNPEKQGPLIEKRGLGFIQTRYWYALKDGHLFCFKDSEDSIPVRVIALAGGRVAAPVSSLEIHISEAGGVRHTLEAPTEDARAEWVMAMLGAIAAAASAAAASGRDGGGGGEGLRELRGEIRSVCATGDGAAVLVGTSQGAIVRYAVTEAEQAVTFVPTGTVLLGADAVEQLAVQEPTGLVLALHGGLLSVLRAPTLTIVKLLHETAPIKAFALDEDEEDALHPCLALACGAELRLYKVFSDTAIEYYHSLPLPHPASFVLWLGRVLFVGSTAEYVLLDTDGRVSPLMPLGGGVLPRGARLDADRVALVGPRGTLLLVSRTGAIDPLCGPRSPPLVWSGSVLALTGTRKGKAVAVLGDSIEVFDATRGGFLRDRSIQNGRCVAVAGSRLFVAGAADIVVADLQQLPDDLRVPGLSVHAAEQVRSPLVPVPREQWEPDEAHPDCMICHAAFSLFRRKHHCRHCGWVVCADCSRQRVRYQDAVVIVCDRCAVLFETV